MKFFIKIIFILFLFLVSPAELITTNNVMISFCILIIAYIFIATEKIPKVTVALLGGALTVFLGLVSQNSSYKGTKRMKI